MDGLLIINKPKGFTSHDVVNIVRKFLNEKKVGHTGTLDPNATGVLPILIGKATKTSKYLTEHNKEYIATIKLGQSTNTGDSEGQIIKEDSNKIELDKKNVEEILQSFLGKQKQLPPVYSSIKVNGKKAYEYARKGQEVLLEARDIEIHEIKLLQLLEDELKFKVLCSKGTYIRTLCEDIAKKCGTVGYMKELTRTKVDSYTLEYAITIEELSINAEKAIQHIISVEEIFQNKKRIDLNNKKKEAFLNGVQLTFELPSDIYKIYNDGVFVGLGVVKNNLLKRDVII